MRPRLATALVFGTSFCILVLEILAGRLMAPLVGVSLETFTGIIGTVLAAIALGNAVGGRLADGGHSAHLIGPALIVGGATSWLAPVLASTLSPLRSAEPVAIVVLSAILFFVPAAFLSAVPPMVAKLRLEDLEETGRVVGDLSAAGTAGALAGTFLTGFVFVAALPTRTLIVIVGAVLVVAGIVLTGWRRLAGQLPAMGAAVVVGGLALVIDGPCDAETPYACVQLVPDPERPGGVSVVLNGARNSYVDLDDPAHLELRYMRLFTAVVESGPEGPLDALHLGGAGFTYPRHLDAVRPGTRSLVLEIDAELVDLAVSDLGLVLDDDLQVTTGDARLALAELPDDGFDLIVGDAFSGLSVPWHLTTDEVAAELARVLRPGGTVVLNLIDGGDLDFVRAELATYAPHFEHLDLITPPEGVDVERARNFILVASDRPLPPIEPDPDDGAVYGETLTRQLATGVRPLTDDHAPVDQLRVAR